MIVSHGSLLQLLLITTCLDHFQLVTAVFPTFLSYSSRIKRATCNSNQFQCNNNQCIKKFLICDGRTDCDDKSDETASLCSNLGITCQSFAFQCTYGACVDGTAKCNGKQDCIDNSDETGPDCKNIARPTRRPDQATTKRPSSSSCRSNESPCRSGQCVKKYVFCDGKVDCEDESDEDAAKCKDIKCDNFYFQCAYGACVKSDAKCDGVKDCRDGSDEAPSVCGSTPTEKPPTNGCSAPPPDDNGQFIFNECHSSDTRPQCVAPRSGKLALGTELNLRCDKGFSLPRNYTIICGQSSKWSPPVQKCRRTCEPLLDPNFKSECSLTEKVNGRLRTKPVPCNEPMFEDTQAIVRCSDFFQTGHSILSCTSSGRWDKNLPKCQPLCGFQDQRFTQTIIDGKPVNHTEYPWHTGVYWNEIQNDGNLKYGYKCGGSLITPTVVLTAAHCVHDEDKNEWVQPQDIGVALGKQKSTWESWEADKIQRFTASEVRKQDGYRGKVDYFILDIALIVLTFPVELTAIVFPVCINYSPSLFGQGSIGNVPGWGVTSSNPSAQASETLQEAKIPFMNRELCLKLLGDEQRYVTYDKFCGGYQDKGPKTYRGDSGGGLIYKDGKTNYIVGIVSTSPNRDDLPVSFYTNVSLHYPWIQFELKSIQR